MADNQNLPKIVHSETDESVEVDGRTYSSLAAYFEDREEELKNKSGK